MIAADTRLSDQPGGSPVAGSGLGAGSRNRAEDRGQREGDDQHRQREHGADEQVAERGGVGPAHGISAHDSAPGPTTSSRIIPT